MQRVILDKEVIFYSKDKNGNYVSIPPLRYSIPELLQKNLVHRIEININDITLRDAISRHSNCDRSWPPIDYLPEIIYGDDVDSPGRLEADVLVVKSIVFKTTKNLSLSWFFSGLSNLIEIQNFVADNVVDTSRMFSDCSKLKKFPSFDTSRVTDMSWMFYGCEFMRTAPALDTSSATNMESMFENCSRLQIVPQYKTDSALSTSKMFKGCSSLSGKTSCLNLLSCKDISGMFHSCSSIESLELSQTDNVTDFSDLCYKCGNLKEVTISKTCCGNNFEGMFDGCSALESVSEFDFSEAENCRRMFRDCSKITSFISSNANKLKDMSQMFSGCVNLHNFDIENYSNVDCRTDAFSNCLNLNLEEMALTSSKLPSGSLYQKLNIFFDGNVSCNGLEYLRNTNCNLSESLFSHKNLKYVMLPKGSIIEFKKKPDVSSYCHDKLLYIDPFTVKTGTYTYTVSRYFLHEWDDEEYTDSYYPLAFENRYKYFEERKNVRNKVYDDFLKSHGSQINEEDNLFFDSAKKNMIDKVDFYAGDTVIKESNQVKLLSLLNSKNITKIVVKDNFVMFDVLFGTDEIVELPSIVIGDRVVSCRGLFSDLRKLKNIESISFLSKNLEDLTAMFLNCESLATIPPLNFVDVTVLDYIFSGCSSLERNPAIDWSVKNTNTISMFGAFENCKSLKYVYNIDLNGRDISDNKGFFRGCYSLVSYMPLNFRERHCADSIFEVSEESSPYYKDNDLVQKMLKSSSYDVFDYYALSHEIEFSSIEELQPSECPNIVRGVVDGTNPKFGIFVNVPSKQTMGLIHISKLNEEQKNNLSDFKKGDAILVKIIREKPDHKLELRLFEYS